MNTSRTPLGELAEAQRKFDEERATSFKWSSPIDADHIRPLVHNALSLAGEAGEVANLVKKIDRGDLSFENLMDELPAELADVLIYVIKIAYQAGIDLDAALAAKMEFNSRRFPPTAPKESVSQFADGLVREAAETAAVLGDENAAKLSRIYSLEGLTPPVLRDRLVAGGLLAIKVAQLAEIEGNDHARELVWRELSTVAQSLQFSYNNLRLLARHDAEFISIFNAQRPESPKAA